MGLSRLATWLKLPSRYRARHFHRREVMRPDYVRVARSLMRRLDFDSAADVGCANGFLLEEFLDAGKRIAGIELSPEVHEVLRHDLRPFVSIGDFSEMSGRFDLVCCVEVAEHIAPARSDDLVDSLTPLATKWIYFTAAPPGQGGHGHINCRPHEEWLAMFGERGWVRDAETTAALRRDLGSLEQAVWLAGNSFLLAPGPVGAASPSG
jgi:SAM-dependent methyltransferase